MFSRGKKTARILSRHQGEEALQAIYNMMQPIFEKKPKKLREEERDTYLVLTLYFSLKNSGFKGYYLSEQGNLSLDTSRSLAKLSCDAFYNYFYESMQVFSGMISTELIVRKLYYDEHANKCDKKWDILNLQLGNYEKNFVDQVYRFIQDNILFFR